MILRVLTVAGAILIAGFATTQPTPYKPDISTLRENYKRADSLRSAAGLSVRNLNIEPQWVDDERVAYQIESSSGITVMIANVKTKEVRPAFDHSRLADAVSAKAETKAQTKDLAYDRFVLFNQGSLARVRFKGRVYYIDLSTYKASDRPSRTRQFSPSARTRNGQVQIRMEEGGDWKDVGDSNSFDGAHLSPDHQWVVTFKRIPGDRKKVFLFESAPGSGSTRGALRERVYDQPGDTLDTFETWVLSTKDGSARKVPLDPIVTGGHPWASSPSFVWIGDSDQGLVNYFIRGYQQYHVVKIDPVSATAKVIIDEVEDTFVDTTSINLRVLGESNELIWRSERDGWGHLYLIDASTGAVKNRITKGDWLVRQVLSVDEGSREIWFTASGREADEDPYHVHYYKANLDGSGLTHLSKADGTHTVAFSPERSYLVDTWSRVDRAPRHVVRSGETGEVVLDLATAEINDAIAVGIRLPERFVAKGRDGKTDIYGIIVRPSHWDPNKKYPVIENIYAGPHDSHVPKGFSPSLHAHGLAELGFIVVQVDGMGTKNRGKEFHDVCWKNIADAGFPDRIAWIKAAARKDSSMDISRVGIYGTSAGGQSSTGALLFHGDFYDVAVSSCGCHGQSN